MVSMRAAVVRRLGLDGSFGETRPITVEDVTVSAPGEGQVLVRVLSAGLCHSDLSAIRGLRGKPVPAVIGHEGAGVVESVGEGVHDLAPGDHVVLVFVNACGRCDLCLTGRPNLCRGSWAARANGTLIDGSRALHDEAGEHLHHWSGLSSFAEYAVVDQGSLVRIDPDVHPLDAAVLGCAVITGVGSVVNTAQLRPGESLVVVGLGGVGLSAVMGGTLAGAGTIVAVDPVEAKRELAIELGASAAIDPTADGARERIAELTDGGADVAVDLAGAHGSTRLAFDALRRAGRLVIGALPGPDTLLEIPVANLVSEEKRILGSYMGSSTAARDIPRYVELFRAGRLPIDRLRSRTIRLDEINDGFDRLSAGQSIREIIDLS